MKKKFLTDNIDVAVIAAFGGLTVISYFAIFFQQHGLLLSLVSLTISLWVYCP